MNLDELMAVWRTQDAAPLHDVNQTLLHLALRRDEAKLQQSRRRERGMIYVVSVVAVMVMACFLGLMIAGRTRQVMTASDLVIGVGGAVAALAAGVATYASHRAQARREERFGESLRDQLSRRIAQLDDAGTRAHRTSVLVLVVMGGICPAAILLLSWRINQKTVSDDGYLLLTMILVCAWSVGSGIWQLRRSVQQDTVPRQRRLEALLQELEGK